MIEHQTTNVNHNSRFLYPAHRESEIGAHELQIDPRNAQNSSNSHPPREFNEFHVEWDSRPSSGAGSTAAKYKLMSPARLPISRSPCLTIPPGFSPTSLLDSPVLLSNIKVESSPTTGTFNNTKIMRDIVVSDTFSSPKDTYDGNKCYERSSSDLEFKTHISLSSGLSSSTILFVALVISVAFECVCFWVAYWLTFFPFVKAPAGANHQNGEPLLHHHAQSQSQPSVHSHSSLSENMVSSSNELMLSVASNPPLHMASSTVASVATVIASEELWQRKISDSGIQSLQYDHKGTSSVNAAERLSEDGYNWRKYGQKQVKGCEFPRSYYKCTHPNCQVKKQLERSQDGQITEIIYKGEHDHPKPQPNRRMAIGTVLTVQDEGSDRYSALNNSEGQTHHQIEQNGTPEHSSIAAADDNAEAEGAQLNRVINEIDDDDDEYDDPESKRRKKDIINMDIAPLSKATREPRVVVQTLSEVDILDDGYRWRKYGQKVVKGNPNPRSYYKCTNTGCPVRKHVERASHDPKAVITTYEGKHNHEVPAAKTSAHNTASNGMFRIGTEEADTISLDLGVGISLSPENRLNDRQQIFDAEAMQQTHPHATDPSSRNMIQAYRDGLTTDNSGRYGAKDGRGGESFCFETQPLNHSSLPFLQNMGGLMMGP
ncbi:hypothetical protein Syun_009666 [Stephania yunnanensis]|uniref:WRKY domain-containing protein n=1 Tax=Stephania yunnanensis TaxID=152371 RepID=A0AAP0PP89_9MAGN